MKPTIDLFCLDGCDADGGQRVLLHCASIMPEGFFSRLILAGPFLPTDLKVEFVHARIQPIDSTHRRYNNWIINEFPKHIKSDFAMIIHRDGYILRPELWTDEFLAYDYIGAPWPFVHATQVGNGGFCIRSKRLALLGAQYKYDRRLQSNEDMWITGTLRPEYLKRGMEVAPIKLAGRFSCEGPIPGIADIETCFGFHGIEQSYVIPHPLRRFL